MTPDEILLLQEVGQALIESFCSVDALTFCYGIYVLLASLALYNLLAKHNKTRATWALCAMLTLIFLLITTYFCLFITSFLRLMAVALIDNPELELSQRVDIANSSILRLELAQTWLSGSTGNALLVIFGDGIVVWRAWAIWPDRHSLIILPALTLLATFSIFLTSSVMQTIAFISPDFLQGQSADLVLAGSIMSIATNAIAVILIGIKAYQYRKFMKETIGPGNSGAGKVLMFLTESGLVYVVFQVITLCLTITDNTPVSTLDIATHIWCAIMNIFSATYPSLVVLIVSHQYSIAHVTGVFVNDDTNLETHISFARSSHLHETTDSIETQSQAEVTVGVYSHTESRYDMEKVPKAQKTEDLV
ncbi:hypothetical protein C8J56DRAFT_1157812 [Mycena floridula]|nr:hypothetical protein C8J56DRAFT_1157812 [Mycena floridula]